jgi:chromosome segregation ATPase
LQKTNSDLSEKVVDLEDQIRTKEEAREEDNGELFKELSSRIESNNQKVQELEKSKTDLSVELEATKKQLEKEQERLAELEQLRVKLYEEIEKLKRNEEDNFIQKITDLEKQMLATETEQQNIQQLRSTSIQKEKELAARLKEISIAKDKIEKETKRAVARAENAKVSKEKEITKMKDKATKQEKQLKQVTEERDKLLETVKDLERQLKYGSKIPKVPSGADDASRITIAINSDTFTMKTSISATMTIYDVVAKVKKRFPEHTAGYRMFLGIRITIFF